MPERVTPFPLPENTIIQLPPDGLARVAVGILRRVYGVELDGTRGTLARLDALLRDHLRLGRYTPREFPATLALTLGAYLGLVLLRHLPEGQWGTSSENLYRTPLPFLLFVRGEYARQLNVVEDCLTLFWTGDGLFPGDYLACHLHSLKQLGFRVER